MTDAPFAAEPVPPDRDALPPLGDLGPEERRDRIVELLAAHDRLPVADLARRFATSEDSIRRDLRRLEGEGRIRRVHGAVLPLAVLTPSLEQRAELHLAEKRRIAAAIVERFVDGETLVLGGGTTAIEIARALPPSRRLTVVTTAPAVALVLAERPSVETILVGGRLDAATCTVTGARAVAAFADLRADRAIVTACGVDAALGLTVSSHEEAFVARAMIDAAATAIVAATADKLATTAAHRIAPLTRCGELVTDRRADPAVVAAIRALGVAVTLV
ncbi:DeoR/GlpR transcriptional regulator [Siculibacillus lacustris]|uniref:DeoR/GlpR transcriptional regulator n=1 Tax=Siculibacillus lacustris TaxID=1549641 RepID=A0A4Q9VT89_9HYPH|nr:DeoR/GlpR family DNA-binding transcription regulator [Siculibacillus lacustris]TBW39259.1 DeoR/GlpR transcriptional regulator [Siculibacillus lacustris]